MHDFDNINQILKNILNGVDPITGEVFDRRDMYNNPTLKRNLKPLFMIASGKAKPESKNLLNRNANAIFEELRLWRLEQAVAINLPAYCVFSDEELWSIAEGDVVDKEDLLLVKGISNKRYEEYGDDIYSIISKYI